MWRRVVVIAVLLSSAVAAADTRTIGLLPIRSKWASPGEIVRITDVLTEVAGEVGLELVALGGASESCFGNTDCYLAEARATSSPKVLAIEVIKTSSGRFHITFRVVDVAANSVQSLPLVRSPLGVLRAQLQPTVAVIRDLIPRPPPRTPLTIPPLPPLPPVPEPIPDTPAPTPWYQTLSINAFVSSAYTYNFNKSPTNALRVFDTDHNSATIDVAELVIQRAVVQPGDTGFRIDLTAGSSVPRVSAAAGLFRDDMGVAEDFDLQQAFVSHDAKLGRGLKIDAGKFTSPAGAEVIEGYDGFGDHYSRSLLFGLAVPFTHTGVRIAYSFSDRLTLTGFGVNGWDNARDTNRAKSFGTQLAILPLTDLSIAVTYLGGAERPDDNSTLRHLGDLVIVWKPVQRLAVTANADYGKDGSARWYGAAGYLRIDPVDRISVAARGEVFSDPDGIRTGTAQRLWETTLTASFGLGRGLTFRIELRYDHSNQKSFPSTSGDRRFQLTTAVNAIYAL